MNIRGTRALITGGCGGIGLAIANRFLEHDKNVILCDIDTAAGDELANTDSRVSTIQCDLSDATQIDDKLGGLFQSDEAPEILCNNVAICPRLDDEGNRLTTLTIPLAQWETVIATNLTSYFYCSQLAIPRMIDRGYGRIINTASIAARTGSFASQCHYVASKAGVLGLTKALSRELAPHGITINAVNPSRVPTAFTHEPGWLELNEKYVQSVPIGRMADPDDIAKTVIFLASDHADFMTGTALEVNGGTYVGP
ncbi:MAG: 3-oxoacyl-ACP reductase [Alphaproteobacteria bacterium]|nr:3-oxoacyl-ACP reductase [Alphaproteobacteria bacterium]|tara:strand:- start:264 stop:1025 length:762 start_codon:yes stop_codon:yes gene_type:complete